MNYLPIFFDSGAKYSFISRKCDRILELPLHKCESSLLVEVVSDKSVPVSDCMRNIVINLNWSKFHEKLLPIELNSFDVVLGIDWLCENYIEILYRKKMVKINPLGREPFMVYGEKRCVNFGIITTMKDGKCLA